VNSHKDRGSAGKPHPLECHAPQARRSVGTQDVKGLAGTIHAAAAVQKSEPKTEVIMSRLTPIQPNEATRELERSFQSSQLGLEAAPNFLPVAVDLRHHMSFVGRIYQVSGAGSADGHYCPFCYDSAGKFVRIHRNANHWQCCVCEAVFYD